MISLLSCFSFPPTVFMQLYKLGCSQANVSNVGLSHPDSFFISGRSETHPEFRIYRIKNCLRDSIRFSFSLIFLALYICLIIGIW